MVYRIGGWAHNRRGRRGRRVGRTQSANCHCHRMHGMAHVPSKKCIWNPEYQATWHRSGPGGKWFGEVTRCGNKARQCPHTSWQNGPAGGAAQRARVPPGVGELQVPRQAKARTVMYASSPVWEGGAQGCGRGRVKAGNRWRQGR